MEFWLWLPVCRIIGSIFYQLAVPFTGIVREYIGAVPEAQAEALAHVKAWDELQAVKSEKREIDQRFAV